MKQIATLAILLILFIGMAGATMPDPTYNSGPASGVKMTALKVLNDAQIVGNLYVNGTEVVDGVISSDTSIGSGYDITWAGGNSLFDMSACSGVWKGPTGVNTIGGILSAPTVAMRWGTGTAQFHGVLQAKDAVVNDTLATETFTSTGTAKVGTTLTAKDMLINDTASFETISTSGTAKVGGAATVASLVSNTTVNAAADGILANSIIVPGEMIINYRLDANSANGTIFIADDAWQVTSIEEVHTVAANYGGLVKALIVRCNSTNTSIQGTVMTTNSFDLKATAETVQTGTLKTPANGAIKLADGNRIGILFNDPLTALSGGVVTIHMKRI